MNFGANVLKFVQSNVQSLLLAGLAIVGVYLLIEKKMSKVIGLILIGIIAVGFVFATTDVKGIMLDLFKTFFK